MDGWITIGTELSTDKFDKQIAGLEKKMKAEEEKKIDIEADINFYQGEFELAIKKTDELANAYERLEKLQKVIARGKATPQQFTEFQDLQSTYGTMEKLETSFLKALNKQDELEQKIEKSRAKYAQINDKVSEYKQKVESIKLEQQVTEINKMKDGFNNVGSSIQNATKKAFGLVLGIFSIRGAYMGVRQAVSTLSQYNEGLANQIQAIKLALASTIEPVINFIVGLVGKAVSLLGYILKTLFGIDIFSRATALNFNKINAGAKGATKAVKELKKQLAGFDEINMLNEDGTTGLGNTLSQTAQDAINVSKQLEDLNKQGETVAANIKKWFLGSDKTDLKGIFQDNVKIFKDYVKTVKDVFKPIVTWIKQNVWEPIKANFKTAIKAMEPYLKPLKTAFKSVVDVFKSYWTSFKKFFNDKIIKPIKDAFSGIGKSLYNAIVPYINKVIQSMNVFLKPLGMEIKEIGVKKTNIPSIGSRAHGGVFYPSLMPKLALGGIINQPR